MQLRAMMALYKENEDLINIGAYNKGSNAAIDRALQMRQPIEDFLSQGQYESVAWKDTVFAMQSLTEPMKVSVAA
jgi:flagellum-specific ATP synthase